jgi:sarcosine oxidase subunit beta
MDCGWGHFGFKSGPVAGKYLAEFMSSGNRPGILKPFSLKRFENFSMLGEMEVGIRC